MKITIRKKINIILFISMFAVGLSIGISFYIQYSNFMMQSVIDKLYNGLFSIYNIADIKKLQEYNSESRFTEEYIKSWEKIKNIQENLKLAYIYLLLMNNEGKLYFVMDTGTHPDPSKKIDVVDEDNFLEVYTRAPPEAYEAFYKEKLVVVKEAYTDQWGTFKSAFYPLKLNDKTIGIIGADYKIDDIIELQNKAKIILAIILLIGIIVIFIAGQIIRKIIVLPIIQLNDGSKEIAKGNLEYNIQINQEDEIGELAQSFNLMARNLKDSFQTIQEYNEQLEEKVEARTEELQETLKKVQELKNQQDGDYFLTTLIANPLMQNRNRSEKVKIEFFIEQKKKFQFKGKTHSLGGDLNIAGNLLFNNKKYTMFFNGDAMGKSMQGAGGALVIGSVLNSIMARSASNKKSLDISPLQWMKDTFLEIQRVMESFDGAMLVSCILGLIEDDTGKLLFFNAEHPFSILYRDGKASFIESEISAHKMGMPFNEDVNLIEFQLKKGDIILCGSDGKDDLILLSNEQGRVINEDEKLFLNLVNESNCEIELIYQKIKETGEFSDDFSLLKISYIFQQTESFENEEEKDIIAQLIKEKKYSEALIELNKLEDLNDLIYIYRKAFCLNKLKRNHEAIKILSNADIKIKEHIKVMKLLSKLYFDLGNYQESKNYLLKLINLFPEDKEILNTLEKINSYLN